MAPVSQSGKSVLISQLLSLYQSTQASGEDEIQGIDQDLAQSAAERGRVAEHTGSPRASLTGDRIHPRGGPRLAHD
jgi:hypothetical protein